MKTKKEEEVVDITANMYCPCCGSGGWDPHWGCWYCPDEGDDDPIKTPAPSQAEKAEKNET